MNKKNKIGEVWVDSGQIMVGDPCYIKKDEWSDDFSQNADTDVPSYGACCTNTLSEKGYGSIGEGLAFVTRTLYGDGSYPVYAEFEGGRVKSITIDFDPSEEEEEEDLGEDW